MKGERPSGQSEAFSPPPAQNAPVPRMYRGESLLPTGDLTGPCEQGFTGVDQQSRPYDMH